MAGHFGTIRRTGVAASGRVLKHTDATFWARVRRGKEDECWPYIGPKTPRGYGVITYRKKSWRAHRLAWTLTHGPIPKGKIICHKCDNPPCCNPKCLFLGTNQDNSDDARQKGRVPTGARHPSKIHGTGYMPRGEKHHSKTQPECMARGERNGGCKISEATALAILERRSATGDSAKKLSLEFDVGIGTVKHLLRGQTWAHLPRPEFISRRGNSRFDESIRDAILSAHAAGLETQAAIARRLGVSTTHVNRLIHKAAGATK